MLIEDMYKSLYVLIINQGLRILNGDFLMNELEWRACFRSRCSLVVNIGRNGPSLLNRKLLPCRLR
jgi:hypothetical protein